MSHSYVKCKDSKKGDDSLIIIVNSDGTLSVDPDTLQKLLANQHQNSAISVVRWDAKTSGNDDGCDDDDPDSRVNLTVEGYFPPTPSSPTPPPTPVADSAASADGGGPDILADSITEILQPEDVEKLETALQSEHAKEILGDVVLDMLQKNGEERGVEEFGGSVGLDHCYASLSGPGAGVSPQTAPVTAVVTAQSTAPTTAQPARGLLATTRGIGIKLGRGRGNLIQTKLAVRPRGSVVPVEQFVVPGGSQVTVAGGNSAEVKAAIKNQATVALQRMDLQVLSGVACKVLLNKVPMQSGTIIVPPSSTGTVQAVEVGQPKVAEVETPKRKVGRPRGSGVTRGRGMPAVRGRGQGRGKAVPKPLTTTTEDKSKQLADEMAATVKALTLAEAEQFANIESMDQSSDTDRVLPLLNKLPAKQVKVYRKSEELTPKPTKGIKPEKPPPKQILPKKSSIESPTVGGKSVMVEHKKEEKVIVVTVEPQISPAVVTSQTVALSSTPSNPAAAVSRTKYPKRENRKPPAHLAEAFGPALFSTPDIIRRVSTDKPPHSAPTPPVTPVTLATPVNPPAATPADHKVEEELSSLVSGEVEPDGIMNTIDAQVAKQEDQLLAEALLLEDLTALHGDEILQDDAPPAQEPQVTSKETQKSKPLSQTSLSAYFSKVGQTTGQGERIEDTMEATTPSPAGTAPDPSAAVRKLPPIELPATRGATKRASLQKDESQVNEVKTPEVNKVTSSNEKRKSTDSKKSTESRKSAARSLGEESEDLSEEEGIHNDEDDPNRLWCICKRPHNNRFMICCDVCEDWFHGKCVGITKAMGEQMEEKEIEWLCPNCKKKKKQEEATKKQEEMVKKKAEGSNIISPKKADVINIASPKNTDGSNPASNKRTAEEAAVTSPIQPTREKKHEASKVIIQHQKLVVLGQETPKSTKVNEIRITKISSKKSVEEARKSVEEVATKTENSKGEAVVTTPPAESNPTPQQNPPSAGLGSGMECIACKKEALVGSVYCSDECIAKHATESLAAIDKNSVIVFERKTGRIYTGANAPSASTLTSWLMAHPSYEVMRPGVHPTAKYYNQPKPASPPQKLNRSLLRQTTLQAKPQGIQLIAALPQPPPIEGPLKKNTPKPETTPSPKTKPQVKPPKGQQQITSLLKVQQPKQELPSPEIKTIPVKSSPTSQQATPANKKQVKEVVKKPVQHSVQKKTPTSNKKAVKEETKEEQKKEEGRGKDFEEQKVRTSVKQTLQEVLSARLQEASDLNLAKDEVQNIAIQIEEELHSLFKETNMKYKAKYRSLIFNIKDKNNLTLFRKIADKSISPVQLVRLTPEELASQELAQWREREARHQLEMIKKTELDMMQLSKTIVMKTHKGEQVVENEDGLAPKVLETSVEIEPVVSTATPPTPALEVTSKRHKSEDSTKQKEEKHSKREKKEEKHKERRHSHKSSQHKSNDRSRSRHRSRQSSSDKRSRSPEDVAKIKEKTDNEKEKSKTRERSKSKERGRSKSRQRERIRSEEGRSKERKRSKSKPRERSRSKGRERSKSKVRERSKSTDKKDTRESRSKSQTRNRSKSKSQSETGEESSCIYQSKSSPISQDTKTSILEEVENVIEHNITKETPKDLDIFTAKPAMFSPKVKELIQEVVKAEEVGAEEDNSDHEPSSTVNIATPPLNVMEEEEVSKPPVWNGTLLMPDVAQFSTSILEVSGSCTDLEFDLPDTLHCVGRIPPETAWDYIAKMKKSGTKQILVVRFSAGNEEDKMSYLSFYSYLSSRDRLGVVGNNSKMIKDFYILPLPSHSPVPQVLLPLDGPGFEDFRPHLLLGIIVRTRRKRLSTDIDLPYLASASKKTERSYTPPLPDEGSYTPPTQHQPDTESFTPPHSPKPLRIINLKTKKNHSTDSPSVSEDFVVDDGDAPYTPEDEGDAPYSPGGAQDDEEEEEVGISSNLDDLDIDQLNRMITLTQQEINNMAKTEQEISVGTSELPQDIMAGSTDEKEDMEEAYSPSGSLTPPMTGSSFLDRNSSKKNLPPTLQDMLASLSKKSDEIKSLDLKSDPIVQAYKSTDAPYSPSEEKDDHSITAEGDGKATPMSEDSYSTQSSVKSTKVNRDPRQRPVTKLSLSQLTDDEIIKKASELGFMNPENPDPIPDELKLRASESTSSLGAEKYNPADEERPIPPPPMFQPPSVQPVYANQQFPPTQVPFSSDFPPPPPMPPSFLPPNQFQPPTMYPQPSVPPLPPLPPSQIPFTNPQPPPPPPPVPEEPPRVLPDYKIRKSKKSKKEKSHKSHKSKKGKRKYSESPPPKSYDSDSKHDYDKSRDRDRYSSKRRERRDSWRSFDDRRDVHEKRRDSWEYEVPPPAITPTLPPPIPGPPPHQFGMPGPMRGAPMRGRFQRGVRGGFRRGFDHPRGRGFFRGRFHQRGGMFPGGGPPPNLGPGPGPGPIPIPEPGVSRTFTPKNVHMEYEDDIRRFEEQRLKQKNLDRRKWRTDSPPPRRRKDKDVDSD